MSTTTPSRSIARGLYHNTSLSPHNTTLLTSFNNLSHQFNTLKHCPSSTLSRQLSTSTQSNRITKLSHSKQPQSTHNARALLHLSTQAAQLQQQLLSTFSPQLQQRLIAVSRSTYCQSHSISTKLNTTTRRHHSKTKQQLQTQHYTLNTRSGRRFATTPPINEPSLIKPTGTPAGFQSSAANPGSKPPPPIQMSKKIVSQTPEFYTHTEPLMGSHPSARQMAEAEAYAVPTPPQNVAMVKKKHTLRGWVWDITESLLIAGSLWVAISAASFFRLEHIRSQCLSDFVHVYFPQDLLSDPLTIGYLENYNNLLLEHIITAIRGIYTAKVHPELVPPWIRDMVTKDGELMNPLEDQPPETLLELCDVLAASRGFGALTTVYTQFHETYLQRQLKQGGKPPSVSIASYLYTHLQRRGWDGTIEQLDSFEHLAQFEMESELCLPLVREHLHKHITSLLVPPQEAAQPSVVVQYLKGVVDYFTSTDPSLSSQQQQQQQPSFSSSPSSPLNNALSPDWERSKSAQFNQIKSLISYLHRETPLPSLIKQRRNKIEQLYIRESIPFTATLNETHHQIQIGRYETLRFILNTLRSYETNLIATPHRLQQYAGNNQVIMSLDDVRLLIQYTQQTMDQIDILVEKYRTPVREQVTRRLCLDFPILGWALQHESTTLGLFFSQREKLVLNHFNQLDEISNYTTYLSNRSRALSDLPLNGDSLSLIPNTWASLPSLSSSPLQSSYISSTSMIVPIDPNLQRDYVNTITRLELDGSLSKWNGDNSFRRSDVVEGWTMGDMTTLAPPQAYTVGDKLMIPIVDIFDPLNSQSYDSEDIDSGVTGVVNSVFNFFGAGKPFGKTVREHLIPLDDALQRGYVNQTQYNHLVAQHQNRLDQAKHGFVSVHNSAPTGSSPDQAKENVIYSPKITINPNPSRPMSNNDSSNGTPEDRSRTQGQPLSIKP